MHRTIRNKKNLNIAYHTTAAAFANRDKPGVIFLPGYKSDMNGSKATFLEEQCKAAGLAYTRFDYSAHGESDGNFKACTLSDWLADCELILDDVVKGKPQIVIGSSMGGWLGLLLALKRPEQVKGFIGIAAAPDFTREVEAKMTKDHRSQMMQKGYFEEPNDYSDEPYIFTQDLLVDGEKHCLLDSDILYKGQVHLLQGKADKDVYWEKALKIKERLSLIEAKVTLIDDGNHSLSRPEDLEVLWRAVQDMLAQITAQQAA